MILTAVGLGVVVLLAGSLPWTALLAASNLRIGTAVPWAILPMSAYLWAYWKYVGGAWGDRDTAATRRENLRAHALSADLWTRSIVAGLLGFAALLTFITVMARVVSLAQSASRFHMPQPPTVCRV